MTDMNAAFGWGATVHQATGMIVAQAGLEPTDALLLLVENADATGRTVLETALDVVERRLRFDAK